MLAPDEVEACRQLLEDSHALVLDAVRFVAARHRLTRDTSDELRGRVMLHLCSHDYAVLRAWRRESSLHTYLVTVITHVFLDYRNAEWGKAKPPALARRGGPEALLLWKLTHRKRLSFDEAVQTMRAEHGVTTSRDTLFAFYSQLPAASGRYFVDVDELAEQEQPGGAADALVAADECASLAARVDRALATSLCDLEAQDRLILKLFFVDGLTRAAIARMLQLDQQRLYPHFLALLERLEAALTAQGIAPTDVRAIVGQHLATSPDTIAQACKNSAAGPSLNGESEPAPGIRSRKPTP